MEKTPVPDLWPLVYASSTTQGSTEDFAEVHCKREWHRRKCAQWNKDNADYFKSNYLQKKLEATLVCKSRFKSGLPLVFVQAVIGLQHLVILEYLVQLLLRRFQEVISVKVAVGTG